MINMSQLFKGKSQSFVLLIQISWVMQLELYLNTADIGVPQGLVRGLFLFNQIFLFHCNNFNVFKFIFVYSFFYHFGMQ